MGLMITVYKHVGAKIIEGNISEARQWYKAINQFAFFLWVAVLCFVYFLNDFLYSIFTIDEDLITMKEDLFPFVMFVLGMDFW